MYPSYITDKYLEDFIENSLKEDQGNGDHSSLASVPDTALDNARLLVKDQGIIAGIDLAVRIFKRVDKNLRVENYLKDGDQVKYGDVAFTVHGKAQSILLGERLALNCMQRMSGIATLTSQYAERIKGTKAKILDTRKTTPQIRGLEKWAVKIGGGENHRFGLFDMIILKDNHVDFSGGIKNAIENTLRYLSHKNLSLKIEVETRSLLEVEEVLQVGRIDRIMLDNMSVENMKEAVKMIAGKFETEASGGVNLNSIRSIAETGVDYISVGALTHSIKSLDMSLKAI